MEHLLDYTLVAFIVMMASLFLYKTLRKSGSGCGDGCSSCKNSCAGNHVKQFKQIPLKVIK